MSQEESLFPLPSPEHKYVMFVQGAPSYTGPVCIFHTDLKPSTDQSNEIITANPGACCHIFQLRTTMESRIDVQRHDFSIK